MSAIARGLAALLTGLATSTVLLLTGAGAASAAGDPFYDCLPSDPVCTVGGPGGAGGGFAALFVLAVIASIGFTVWKVATSRRMAREAGMSTRDATAMTLLSDDGFEATYLASNLRGRPVPPPAAPATPAAPVPMAQRLRELAELRDQGLITPEEHDARRAQILDSL